MAIIPFDRGAMAKRKRLTMGLIAVLLIGAAGVALSVRHRPRMSDAVNPTYWVQRWQGQDLYDESARILKHGNRQLPEIALTFDDGPHEPTGRHLLDVLKEHRVRATFMVVGSQAQQRPDLIRRMLADGHEVGNHTQDHLRLDALQAGTARREINNCDITLFAVARRHTRLLRPPGMRYNDTVLRVARELDYQVVSWTLGAKDHEEVTPDFIVDHIVDGAENGSIVLMHDGYPCTVTALPRVIAGLRRDGYRFVTISEMLAHLPRPVRVDANPGPVLPFGR